MSYSITYNGFTFDIGKKFAIKTTGKSFEAVQYSIVCECILSGADEAAFQASLSTAITRLQEPCESFKLSINASSTVSWSYAVDGGALTVDADYPSNDLKGLVATGIVCTINFSKNVEYSRDTYEYGEMLHTASYDDTLKAVMTVKQRFHTIGSDSAKTAALAYVDAYTIPTGFILGEHNVTNDNTDNFAELTMSLKETDFTYPGSEFVDFEIKLTRTVVDQSAMNWMVQTQVSGTCKVKKSSRDGVVTDGTEIYSYKSAVLTEVKKYFGKDLYYEDFFFDWDFKNRIISFVIVGFEGMVADQKKIKEASFEMAVSYQNNQRKVPLVEGGWYLSQETPPFLLVTISGSIKKYNDNKINIKVPTSTNDVTLIEPPRVTTLAPVFKNESMIIYGWTFSATYHVTLNKDLLKILTNPDMNSESYGIKSIFTDFKMAKTTGSFDSGKAPIRRLEGASG